MAQKWVVLKTFTINIHGTDYTYEKGAEWTQPEGWELDPQLQSTLNPMRNNGVAFTYKVIIPGKTVDPQGNVTKNIKDFHGVVLPVGTKQTKAS